MVAKMRAEMEAIDMKFNFRDWFQSGKTLEQVRSILGLPATGEAASHINWAAFQNYLKYVQEMEVKAANAARVAEIKQKLTFKGWYLDGKSFAQVRAILELPAKGSAVGHPNWETFQAYLKFFKEYSQQFT
ncbi:putative PexRD1 secreted RxLR effector peptide [Phytophthora cinnamomi]|uniref:putative PexRD1 secreted RxLR effector peptide n=1 Tax=Phytophthora cinnamomi TaxID=4785 RepID=UPI00355ACD8C|nr:putative PexRD1 secreted RxLR effector peptide [Phytophthora cinnamomi]